MRTASNLRAAGRAAAILLLLTAAAAAFAVQAAAQETVRTRAWQHSDFGRMVFDWPERVEFTAEQSDGVLTVRFDRPITTDLETVAARLPAYLSGASIGADGQVLRFDLAQPVQLTTFRNGAAVVLDLRPADAAAVPAPTAPPPPAQEAPPAPPPAPVADADGGPPAPTALVPVALSDTGEATRLVFEWSGPVGYRIERDGRRLALIFDRPAAIDGRALGRSLPAARAELESVRAVGGETTVRLILAEGVTARDSVIDGDVALDLAPAEATADAAPDSAVPDSAIPDSAIPDSATPDSATPDSAAEPAAAPAPEPTTETAEATPEPDAPVDEAPPAADAASADEATPTSEEPQDAQPAPDAADAADVAESDGDDEAAEAEAERARIAAEDAAAAEAVESGELVLRRNQADRQREERGPALVSYGFQWPEPVGAAVFRRADDVWIVFDLRVPVDLAPLRAQGEPLVDRIEQLPVTGATVLRLRVPDTSVNPTARREGFDWVVDLRKTPMGPRRQVEIRAEATADTGPVLVFPTDEPGRIVSFPDPDVGDTVRIATYHGSGHGMDGLRRYPEFELLPTAQGVAMTTRSERVLLDRHFDGYQIFAPDGLHISAVSPETPVSAGPALSANRLFNFEQWKRGEPGDFLEARQTLYRAVTEVPDANKTEARLDVARFYLARDYGPEALGVLNVVAADTPERAEAPDFRALRGAAALLARDAEAARSDWSDPRLDGFAESAIWRGATLARLGMYRQAHEQFRGGESLLRRYPQPLKGELALLRIEAALANRDLRTATSWLDALDEEADQLPRGLLGDLRFHQARVAAARTDFEEAEGLWRDLTQGPDLKNAVRSEQALINLGLQQGDVSREEALERLEDLRYQWRGDRFELMVLRRLGELYLEDRDYFRGLGAYRTAVSYFPEDPVSEELAQIMTDIFRRLYLDGEADKLPPLRALALYDEFRELTPSGPEGDRMIENLADRLVAVDLLERAARVLDQQVEFRLEGEERARVGAKLALIRLLDGRPTQAIDALNRTAIIGLSEALQADRRRIRAKANFELGDEAEAIKLLAGDVSRAADLLRRDIFWDAEDWAEVAKVLQRLAGDPPDNPGQGVPLDRARHVVNWAVALFFDGDRRGLEDIREIFGAAMANSELAGVFDFITSEPEVGSSADLSDTVARLASANGFNAFLEEYRGKLLAEPDADPDAAPDAALGADPDADADPDAGAEAAQEAAGQPQG
ncbi:MAG: tetratricopeptide repeat protein [Alphaproteobacteria bacterium]|nr:tetratricopeptide repeat protein [Alphaproteobacteria bacterium]